MLWKGQSSKITLDNIGEYIPLTYGVISLHTIMLWAYSPRDHLLKAPVNFIQSAIHKHHIFSYLEYAPVAIESRDVTLRN